MEKVYDVAVAGLGAVGSAATYHLARAGVSVAGFDRYVPPHTLGSSHGLTRIIRQAYFEHPQYVPLVLRAYELWKQLAEECGRRLYLNTGGIYLGRPKGKLLTGVNLSAHAFSLPCESLSKEQVRERFQAFHPGPEEQAIWEQRAGILFPEECIEAHLRLAGSYGAQLRFEEEVTSWKKDGDGMEVFTRNGRYLAGKLLLAPGAWLSGLTGGTDLKLTVERQVLFWFAPAANPEHFAPENCPVFIWEHAPGRIFYGFPDLGDGVKATVDHEGRTVDPDFLDRGKVTPEDEKILRELLSHRLPDAAGKRLSSAVCMYTNTPDKHFVIDFHPQHPQVLIASACSGHGFKFSCATGEALAQMLTEGRSRLDLSPFRLSRLSRRFC